MEGERFVYLPRKERCSNSRIWAFRHKIWEITSPPGKEFSPCRQNAAPSNFLFALHCVALMQQSGHSTIEPPFALPNRLKTRRIPGTRKLAYVGIHKAAILPLENQRYSARWSHPLFTNDDFGKAFEG